MSFLLSHHVFLAFPRTHSLFLSESASFSLVIFVASVLLSDNSRMHYVESDESTPPPPLPALHGHVLVLGAGDTVIEFKI